VRFIRAASAGKNVMGRAQWHKKQSWRQPAATPEREKELNWRLASKTSTGLAGEIGIHHFDVAASWFYKTRPKAVSGFGSTILWDDGRDVSDSIQVVFEFPEGVNFVYDASLATSFDAEYEVYHGTFGTILYRENKAWMFKEVDSPMLGWEVYARKDQFYKEAGIALIAGGSKQDVLTQKPTDASPFPQSDLFYALKSFTYNVGLVRGAIEDFISTYGDADPKALKDHVSTLKLEPVPGYQDGFDATVLGIKANEAVVKKQRFAFDPSLFEL
jgi:predicted dehydrogenase